MCTFSQINRCAWVNSLTLAALWCKDSVFINGPCVFLSLSLAAVGKCRQIRISKIGSGRLRLHISWISGAINRAYFCLHFQRLKKCAVMWKATICTIYSLLLQMSVFWLVLVNLIKVWLCKHHLADLGKRLTIEYPESTPYLLYLCQREPVFWLIYVFLFTLFAVWVRAHIVKTAHLKLKMCHLCHLHLRVSHTSVRCFHGSNINNSHNRNTSQELTCGFGSSHRWYLNFIFLINHTSCLFLDLQEAPSL